MLGDRRALGNKCIDLSGGRVRQRDGLVCPQIVGDVRRERCHPDRDFRLVDEEAARLQIGTRVQRIGIDLRRHQMIRLRHGDAGQLDDSHVGMITVWMLGNREHLRPNNLMIVIIERGAVERRIELEVRRSEGCTGAVDNDWCPARHLDASNAGQVGVLHHLRQIDLRRDQDAECRLGDLDNLCGIGGTAEITFSPR